MKRTTGRHFRSRSDKKAASRHETGEGRLTAEEPDDNAQDSRLSTVDLLMLAWATTVWVTAA